MPAMDAAVADAEGDATPAVRLTDEERRIAETLSPLPAPPPDTTNRWADDPRAALLGQRLFFEPGYSGRLAVGDDGNNGGLGAMGEAGRVSCQSCHRGDGLDDRRSRPGNVSLGADYLGRNAPTLLDSSQYRWVNWAGRFSAQWELPLAVAENPKNMNSDRLRVAHVLYDKYRADYEAIFGPMDPGLADPARFPPTGKPKAATAPDGAWEGMAEADRQLVNRTFVNFGKVLEAYVRRLSSGRSRFDDYVAGHEWTLSADEVEGLRLFIGKAGCVKCHAGPHLSDDQFHDIGVAQAGAHAPASDLGRFTDVAALMASPFNSAGAFSDDPHAGRLDGLAATPSPELQGQFRTPSLRNVATTAPYMHAGQLATLEEVVDFYDRGGDAPAAGTKDPMIRPLELSPPEKAQLVAFLRTLTASLSTPALLEDTSAR
jgi:cytochrome c peroxidase